MIGTGGQTTTVRGLAEVLRLDPWCSIPNGSWNSSNRASRSSSVAKWRRQATSVVFERSPHHLVIGREAAAGSLNFLPIPRPTPNPCPSAMAARATSKHHDPARVPRCLAKNFADPSHCPCLQLLRFDHCCGNHIAIAFQIERSPYLHHVGRPPRSGSPKHVRQHWRWK